MYKVTTKLTYYAPDGKYCNIPQSKELCRFCMKHKDGHTCSLDQELLHKDGQAVLKTKRCMYNTSNVITESEPVVISTPEVISMTADQFTKLYKTLRSQGFNEDMALKLTNKKLKEESKR